MRRTFGSTKRGLMALENEDPNAGSAGGEAELGAAEDSLETDLIEIAEDGADGDQQEAEIDEAVEVTEALEALADDLGAIATEAGGLNSHTAQAISRQVQFLYGRIGHEHHSMPALESFGSTSGRIGSTTIGMEDIRDQARKIWDKIIEAIKKSIQWVKDYFTKLFGAANKLERRAKALAERCAKTTGTPKGNVENERVAKALAIGTAVPTGMAAKVGTMKTLADKVFSATVLKDAETLAEVLEKREAPTADGNAHSRELNLPVVANEEGEGFAASPNGLQTVRSEELPGGMAIFGQQIANGADASAILENFSRQFLRVGKFKPNAKGEVKKEMPALSPADGEKVSETIADLAIVIQGYKSTLDKLNKAKDRILKAAEKLGRDSATAKDEEEKTTFKVAQRMGGMAARFLDQPATDYSRYCLATGTALLNYVELSLKKIEA